MVVDEVTPDEPTHYHKCNNCDCVWEHPDSYANTYFLLKESHKCPRCGEDQRIKYDIAEDEDIDYPHPAPFYESIKDEVD